jgi:hypothetical protein
VFIERCLSAVSTGKPQIVSIPPLFDFSLIYQDIASWVVICEIIELTMTCPESLRDYFSQFGEVLECTVMRDNNTGRSRGFGFLTFKDPKTVNIVMVKEHFLDGKIVSFGFFMSFVLM